MQKGKTASKTVRGLCIAAMLIAINCVLRLLVIPISNTINVRFFYLASSVAAVLLGPFYASAVGASADIISYFLKPTGPYFFGFTLNAAIEGLVFGIFFYKKKPKFWKIIIARLITFAVIDMGLTPFWLHMMYSVPLIPAFYLERLIKCTILFPVEIAMMFAVNSAVYKASYNL